MAPGDIQRIFEKLEALGNQNAVLVERMEAMKENYVELKALMQGIKGNGCNLGSMNKDALKRLDTRTAKMEGWVTKLALIVAGSAGSGVGIAKLVEKLWE